MVETFLYAVALTGSIATGKSTTAKILKGMGFTIIDADIISHIILDEEHAKIATLFGDYLVLDNKVDRKALGNIVFANKDKRKVLEALLHPPIYNRIVSLCEELDKNKLPYFVDIPLFFENKRYPIKKSLVVFTPKKVQLQRLMHREGYCEESAIKRIDTQIDIAKKVKWADYVIDNSGTLTQLKQECTRIRDMIMKDFR